MEKIRESISILVPGVFVIVLSGLAVLSWYWTPIAEWFETHPLEVEATVTASLISALAVPAVLSFVFLGLLVGNLFRAVSASFTDQEFFKWLPRLNRIPWDDTLYRSRFPYLHAQEEIHSKLEKSGLVHDCSLFNEPTIDRSGNPKHTDTVGEYCRKLVPALVVELWRIVVGLFVGAWNVLVGLLSGLLVVLLLPNERLIKTHPLVDRLRRCIVRSVVRLRRLMVGRQKSKNGQRENDAAIRVRLSNNDTPRAHAVYNYMKTQLESAGSKAYPTVRWLEDRTRLFHGMFLALLFGLLAGSVIMASVNDTLNPQHNSSRAWMVLGCGVMAFSMLGIYLLACKIRRVRGEEVRVALMAYLAQFHSDVPTQGEPQEGTPATSDN